MGVRAVRAQRAFTLIEMLVVIVIAGIVLTLAAPSFRDMFRMQRLRSINAQLVTDLQFARSEAVARNANVRVNFRTNAAMTCYSIFTANGTDAACNCLATPACAAGGLTEVRSVRVPVDSEVRVVRGAGMPIEFAFDSITLGLWQNTGDSGPPSVLTYMINTSINSSLSLRTQINLGGRPTVCAPAGSIVQVTSCS